MSAAPARTPGKGYEVKAMDSLPDVEPLRKELAAFQKCVEGDGWRLLSLCEVSAISGYALDPESCAPIDPKVLKAVAGAAFKKVAEGMEVNGKFGQWSCGFLGSRWFDLKAEDFGLDYVRCAFYSKKHYTGKWECDKPYMIQITAEKSR